MADKFPAIADLLSCPDDWGSLRFLSGAFRCTHCDRSFPIHEENLAEILPSQPLELPASIEGGYGDGYSRAFKQPFHPSETSGAWGAEETAAAAWAGKRHRQVATVKPLVTEGISVDETVLCDISAGAGYYTFAYADHFRFVLHCDLSVDNLNYARRKARVRGIENILFLRADYFALPFRQTLDRILCFDTLIRGEVHESALLGSILRSLRPSGCAVVDFHNWWHNPLRRIGLLPQNFPKNGSYTAMELSSLLRSSGVDEFELRPFVQEIATNGRAARLLKRVIPPTRFLVRLRPPAFQARSEPFESAASA